jgi:amino acid permease
VLALPSVTVHAGVLPSTLAIGLVWAYCAISGLLIGEVCINSKARWRIYIYLFVLVLSHIYIN